jgi:hypothetical protein
MNTNPEFLKERLKQIDEEREAILKLLSIWSGELQKAGVRAVPKITSDSYSIRGRVVDATIELIHKLGKQVGNQEILINLDERGISLGDTKNKQANLNAILSAETKKKSGRLKKVARGVYDIK